MLTASLLRDAVLRCAVQVVNERLSPNCKARLTVENDDRASLYHVLDLMKVHRATGETYGVCVCVSVVPSGCEKRGGCEGVF